MQHETYSSPLSSDASTHKFNPMLGPSPHCTIRNIELFIFLNWRVINNNKNPSLEGHRTFLFPIGSLSHTQYYEPYTIHRRATQN